MKHNKKEEEFVYKEICKLFREAKNRGYESFDTSTKYYYMLIKLSLLITK